MGINVYLCWINCSCFVLVTKYTIFKGQWQRKRTFYIKVFDLTIGKLIVVWRYVNAWNTF